MQRQAADADNIDTARAMYAAQSGRGGMSSKGGRKN